MVDASVGIKVAINYRKNGVGHFFSPLHTFIDPATSPVITADILGLRRVMSARP